jgi:uncharacterized protein (UPF0335 family)
MTQNVDSSERSLLNGYIDKISEVQRSIQELQTEINQIRRDARTDGFNMEAVNILSQIIAKSSHDEGVGLLQDIVEYAHQIGIKLDSVTVETEEKAVERNKTDEVETVSVSRFRAIESPVDRRFALLLQLGIGLAVAWMFIALLN